MVVLVQGYGDEAKDGGREICYLQKSDFEGASGDGESKPINMMVVLSKLQLLFTKIRFGGCGYFVVAMVDLVGVL